MALKVYPSGAVRCALTNSCGEPTKELNCNHGVLISDQHFDAFLKCRTKAHFIFSSARTGEPSHPIGDWQGHITENYQKSCRDYLRSVSGADCFVGTPRPEDLRNAKTTTASGIDEYLVLLSVSETCRYKILMCWSSGVLTFYGKGYRCLSNKPRAHRNAAMSV
jgi:hypothetical protein